MDLPDDGVAVQTDLPVDSEVPGLTDSEDPIGLNLSEEEINCSRNENSITNIHSDEGLSNDPDDQLDMGISKRKNIHVSTGTISSEVVHLENDSKVAMSAINSDTDEPLSKHLHLEQDGPTFILTLPEGVEGLTAGVVELGQRALSSNLMPTEVFNGENSMNAGDINQAWFTSREDKNSLHNREPSNTGHMWKQGMWSKDEIEVLENNIRHYCEKHNITDPATIIFEMTKDERKDFYRSVAKDLNRPLFSVYRRVIRMYDKKNHVGKYTPEDLERLKKLRSVYGNDWQAIGAVMGRSASSIKDRCRLMKENCNQGKWLPAEERRLAEAVYELASAIPGERITSGLSWAAVAERVGTRSEKQCRTKWLNYLNWKEAGGTEWTREDYISLICRVYGLNVNDENMIDWAELAKGWASVRSPQWLRGKWWSLKRHVPNAITLPFRDICDYLYQHYVQKIRLKDESTSTSENVSSLHSHPQAHLTGHTPTSILCSPTDSISSPLEMEGAISTAAIRELNHSSVTTNLVTTTVVETINSPATTISSVGMSPMLQTLEVLPQGIQLTPANPQTFLLTHPTQSIPLTASISPNQIIIQAVTTESLQGRDNMAIQMSSQPQIIISATGGATALTSLAPNTIAATHSGVSGVLTLNSDQMRSDASTPTVNSGDFGGDDQESLIEETFQNQNMDDSEGLDEGVEDLGSEQISDDCKQTVSAHLILSDPMLPASNSPDLIVVDIQKSQSGDDCLESVSGSDN
ncbi:cyclin-D-binding Myb-like transcription factor 1 isoform X3 [Centruroides vittatus]|uniref:cyclin-D-binding Myb-like transcription factor 1 isoform X3 n=1 Tax=Centruroides vittatus TaxID=120091 RepID=UPI0035105E8F